MLYYVMQDDTAVRGALKTEASAQKKMSEQKETPFIVALLAGGCAGTAVDVALFPIDTIKTRLQVDRTSFSHLLPPAFHDYHATYLFSSFFSCTSCSFPPYLLINNLCSRLKASWQQEASREFTTGWRLQQQDLRREQLSSSPRNEMLFPLTSDA